MRISPTDLVVCINTANEVADELLRRSLADVTPRSADMLFEICHELSGKSVEIYELTDKPAEGNWLLGASLLSLDKAQILLSADLNHCWKRFVLCKEVFHVLLDREEYRNIDIFGHVEEITLSFPLDDSKPNKPVAIEFLAEVGAMELLFPYKWRLIALERDNADPATLADRYKIPTVLVEKYLGAAYMENLRPFVVAAHHGPR